MPIDVETPGSDGWLMQKAWIELRHARRHFTKLENYRRGTPPLALSTPSLTSAFYRLQQTSRTNVSDLVVQALVERLSVRTIRTAASTDDEGDVQATRMWQASGMIVSQSDLFRMLATHGKAFTSTAAPSDAPDSWSSMVPEDPRECVVLYDASRQPIAGFKLFHDALTGYDYAILWRPGRKVVAWAQKGTPPPPEKKDRALTVPRIQFNPSRFDIRPERPDDAPEDDLTTPLWSESYEVLDIPLVEHVAPDGVGVFERHLDLVDAINHIYLQGIVIATLQAFKQRAIEEPPDGLPSHDEDGNAINYSDVFSADPGALWRIPAGAKIWESGQVDIGGILNLGKDALQRFAAVTRTPFSMFSSDSTNQSAEGAQLTREGLVFKAEDFQRVENLGIGRGLSIGFKFMPDEIRYADVDGERVDRADLAGLAVDWLPAERYSLQEKATADAAASSLPRRQRLRLIWGFTPAEVDIAMAQAREDALIAPVPTPRRLPPPPANPGAKDPATQPQPPAAPGVPGDPAAPQPSA